MEGVVSGKDVTKLASMAKLKRGRFRGEMTDSCLQYWNLRLRARVRIVASRL